MKNLISTMIPVALLGLAFAACTPPDSKDKDDDDGGSGGSRTERGGEGGSAGGAGQAGAGQAGAGPAKPPPVNLTLVDCTSPDNLEDAKCTKKMLSDSPKVGSGPRFAGFSAGTNDVRLGFLEGTLLTVAVETGSNTDDKGVVGTVDIVTGERKVLSGKYEDPAEGTIEVGKGPALNGVFGVIKSKSGLLLATVNPGATAFAIVSIDPAT
ncbi:MAG TPA: hypothetical protein VFS00_04510, partial [Polyangiaceae bacterium]|nr:hypothetical protein [Polyangiaceae bacterium]